MMDSLPEIYPLTSLQIGDIQSRRSLVFLFFSASSKRILILVDNRPWSSHPPSISTQLWQLMVTKYRVSPFINTKTLNEDSDFGRNDRLVSSFENLKGARRWYSVIDAAEWQKKLSEALHGFIVFEVLWKDVRGINYLNELQTDASLALEVKFMRKWEFNEVKEAMKQISSWFSGAEAEKESLMRNLRKISDLNLSNFIALTSAKDMSFRSASFFKALPEDVSHDAEDSLPLATEKPRLTMASLDEKEIHGESIHDDEQRSCSSRTKNVEMERTSNVPIQYMDKLLLLRFSDSILPFRLKNVLMSDLGLLRKLESGLPCWVVFLQSYPLFCYLYRPWMRQLARTIYILISLSTFVIAFYDLYKNVPLLKAAVSSFCGPFFEWIEKLDMLSRIQYLGTILFLQNFEKVVEWFVVMARTMRPMFVIITKPLVGPLTGLAELVSPVWYACVRAGEFLTSMIMLVFESFYDMYLGFIGILFCPFEFLYFSLWGVGDVSFIPPNDSTSQEFFPYRNSSSFLFLYFSVTVASAYPILCSMVELFLVPIRCVVALANYVASVLPSVFILIKDIWSIIGGMLPLAHISRSTRDRKSTSSVLRQLWNDLLRQIFSAAQGIINGFSAFFIACNTHRLSIYNYVWACLVRIAHALHFNHRGRHCHHKEDDKECELCE